MIKFDYRSDNCWIVANPVELPHVAAFRQQRSGGLIVRRVRTSNVTPAQRSDATRRKAASKSCDDATPAHSFQTLLANLATVGLNRMSHRDRGLGTYDVTTKPTPVQQ